MSTDASQRVVETEPGDFLEFHDADVESVLIAPLELTIRFRHIALYRRESATVHGVYSCRAILHATGVRSLEITDCMHTSHDVLTEGAIRSATGVELVECDQLHDVPNGQVTLQWSHSAAKLKCAAARMRVLITALGRRFESYEE